MKDQIPDAFPRLEKMLFISLLITINVVLSGCDFSRVEISCNDHLANAGLGHFEDLQQGVIRDSETGLQWFRCSVGQRYTPRGCTGVPALLSLAEAQDYIVEISEKAGAQWRLPNYTEFSSIVRKDCKNPAFNPNAFPNLMIENYWSLGAGANEGKACVVYTLNGARSCRVIDRDTPRPFLMVKDV
jgi:hypothetical protein